MFNVAATYRQLHLWILGRTKDGRSGPRYLVTVYHPWSWPAEFKWRSSGVEWGPGNSPSVEEPVFRAASWRDGQRRSRSFSTQVAVDIDFDHGVEEQCQPRLETVVDEWRER